MALGNQGGQGSRGGGGGGGNRPARTPPPGAPKGAVWAGPHQPGNMRGIGAGWWAPRTGGGGGGGGSGFHSTATPPAPGFPKGGNKGAGSGGGHGAGNKSAGGGNKNKGGNKPGGNKPSANTPTYSPAIMAAAHALANAQTKGPITELNTQAAQNDAQTQAALGLTGGYFNQLGQQAQQGVTQTQGIQSALNTQLANIGQGTQSQLASLGPAALQNFNQYAPSSGPNSMASGPMAQLSSQLARQQGLAAQNQGAFQGYGAIQGANASGLAASNLGTFAKQGQESLTNIAQSGQVRNEPITAKIAGLRATQGADYATALRSLSQQDIANKLTNQALGLKNKTLNASINEAAARNRTTRRGQTLSAKAAAHRAKIQGQENNPNFVGSTAWERVQNSKRANFADDPNAVGSAAWARVQARKSGGSGGRSGGGFQTPLEENAWYQKLGAVETAIQTWQRQGGIMGRKKDGTIGIVEPHPTNARMKQVLASKYDQNAVQAAFELLGWGHITPQTAQNIRRSSHIRIDAGTFRNKPIRIAPPPSGPGPSGGSTRPPSASDVNAATGAG